MHAQGVKQLIFVVVVIVVVHTKIATSRLLGVLASAVTMSKCDELFASRVTTSATNHTF